MDKLLVVCGPTATGKTQLGIQLAKKFDGEIVSADSRQVYKGMDIGTGKDLKSNFQFKFFNLQSNSKFKNFQTGYYLFDEVKVWMLDVVEPSEQFSVAQYHELASKIVNDIWKRSKLPIIVGGTGLYIKALVDGIETINIPPDESLREDLRDKTPEELLEMLNTISPNLASSLNNSEQKNKQRLIRRIEVAKYQKSNSNISINQYIKTNNDVLMVGLTALRQVLNECIDKRVDMRLKQGMIEEVEGLLKNGVTHERLQSFGLEYRVIDSYLQGKYGKEEMLQHLKSQIHAFAKRQMTWFKQDKRINWFDITKPDWREKVEDMAREWYNKIQ